MVAVGYQVQIESCDILQTKILVANVIVVGKWVTAKKNVLMQIFYLLVIYVQAPTTMQETARILLATAVECLATILVTVRVHEWLVPLYALTAGPPLTIFGNAHKQD
mmetsp:Transcript_12213/g.20247  ORF Transcript_12213/g.20247 Transcript_12213/m.20247 type:complete len:107 (-) Transcript_12213:523-843(-)